MEAPRSVFAGAWIAVVECTIGLGYGVFLMIRDFQGYEDHGAVISGWGTALWFYFIFGAVLAGAVFLLMGNRWGRGPIVMLNLCLAGVAFYMFTSGAIALGMVTALFALSALACMFNPKAVDWAASAHGA